MHNKSKNLYFSIKNVAFFTQFGISTVTPIILMTLLGNWIVEKFAWPTWVTMIFIFIGLASTIVSFISGIKKMTKMSENASASSSTDNKKNSEEGF